MGRQLQAADIIRLRDRVSYSNFWRLGFSVISRTASIQRVYMAAKATYSEVRKIKPKEALARRLGIKY
jgi:hypothetical protein